MRPELVIRTMAVHEANLMHCDTGRYLLAVAQLAEGGDGTPNDSDLRSIAVASALCDRDPRYDGDLVVLNAGNAFEPPFLYDESFRGVGRMNPRILPVAKHLSGMINALPHITQVTIYQSGRDVPWMSITPFADKADSRISHEDLELVGWQSQAT